MGGRSRRRCSRCRVVIVVVRQELLLSSHSDFEVMTLPVHVFVMSARVVPPLVVVMRVIGRGPTATVFGYVVVRHGRKPVRVLGLHRRVPLVVVGRRGDLRERERSELIRAKGLLRLPDELHPGDSGGEATSYECSVMRVNSRVADGSQRRSTCLRIWDWLRNVRDD